MWTNSNFLRPRFFPTLITSQIQTERQTRFFPTFTKTQRACKQFDHLPCLFTTFLAQYASSNFTRHWPRWSCFHFPFQKSYFFLHVSTERNNNCAVAVPAAVFLTVRPPFCFFASKECVFNRPYGVQSRFRGPRTAPFRVRFAPERSQRSISAGNCVSNNVGSLQT